MSQKFKDLQKPYFTFVLEYLEKHNQLGKEMMGLHGELVVQIRKELGFEDGEDYTGWFSLRNAQKEEAIRRDTEFTKQIIVKRILDLDMHAAVLSEGAEELEKAGSEVESGVSPPSEGEKGSGSILS
jgi:hypothetical protein